MADLNPELHARLRELDHELEEGDITKKGYEKRRTLLLSQYLGGPPAAAQPQQNIPPVISEEPQLYSSPELHNQGFGGSAPPPFAIGHGGSDPAQYGPAGLHNTHDMRAGSGDYSAYPPSQVGRFQERQLGMRTNSMQLHPAFPRESYIRPTTPDGRAYSRESTMLNSDYAFNPANQPGYGDPGVSDYNQADSRLSTMLDSQQGYFSDFAGQQMQEQRDSYGGPDRYSTGDAFSPTAAIPPPMLNLQDMPIVACQAPLEPRDVPFAVYDPHNGSVPMSKFDNIGAVLRHRGKVNGRRNAYWVLDQKGKEMASITWEKLASRAEKVAKVIRDKSNLYRGDRVALVYRDTEIIDFAVALLGCFIAGVVAVPINTVDDYQKLSLLLTTTQAHLALTTDNNLKAFHRDISQNRLKWPAGVEWWKTNEFGSYHPKKSDEAPPLQVPDLAYIEFSRAPTGDLRGVVLSHRTIMHQMACISAVISTLPLSGEKTDTFSPGLRDRNGNPVVHGPKSVPGEVILSYLDPREGVGLILGVLYGVYGGHTTVWLEPKTVETPGLYAHLISKYRTSIMVADYPGLKRAAYNYQQAPMDTRNFKKNIEPNFSSVKICLIDTLTVDCEFHEILADRWLKPLRNPRAREVVAPMLCLPEHGGMIISVRDWLGGEERMGCPLSEEEPEMPPEEKKSDSADNAGPNGYTSLIGGVTTKQSDQKQIRTELSEVLLDKEALKTNDVIVLAFGEEARRRANEPGTLRAGAFGYPIPDATLALVDPETNLLCSPYTVGEIWVDSPSLSGGFWALPKHTESIFHARPFKFVEGNPTPVLVEPEFLRTGLLGCIIDGKVFVLGLYEDRIRQRVEWIEHGLQEVEHRYFFVQHLVSSIMKTVPKIYDCSAFDSHVNGEYLPIILVETQSASTAPTTAGGPPRQLDIPFLDSLSERVMDMLYQEHHLRVYCVMITAPNTLPRIVKNGRREIGNMLCRREFDNGNLPCVHVKFGVERAVQNLPLGDDPAGGIWSPLSAEARMSMLHMQDKQYSGMDYREVVIDDRSSTPLNQFSNIQDLMQWRVSRQPEELAYCTIDGRGKEGKGINWKKFDQKVAAVAVYLKNKVKVIPGDHLILMYTHSEDFVYAVHACFAIGAVAIPLGPLDQNRLNEDAPALLGVISDLRVKAILVNQEVDHVFRQKVVSQHLKQSALIAKVSMPNTYNTSKPPKQSSGCRDLGLTIRSAWVQPGHPVLIWAYWSPDQKRTAVQLGHDTIMALCKVQKETCQMMSTRPVLGCVRSTIGLGFIHTCLMGIFLAAPTYLVSPVDFAQNPNILFQSLSRYKIKDTYATSQMLDHAMGHMAGKASTLHELKNLMISTDGRPRVDVYQKVRMHFAAAGLDRTSINTIYSHVLNPMIASRSYMCIEPIELWLDMNALRRGLVVPVDPDSDPFALLIQDSGMVPFSTQISIVNPETNRLCLVGEYGEIWVQSEANACCFYGSRDILDAERFNGHTLDGDIHARYVRTGDLGFLHNVSRAIGPGGALVEMQVLFVLGNIGETFEINGLSHFPMDIELSVEKCHRNIVPSGCAVFQAGGLVVILVEIYRKNFLASIVPVIVNAVLNEHHLVADIIAFVAKGDFPRSRLGEKQRGKILGTWVTRKMRTIAQFKIRDPDAPEGMGIAEEPIGMRTGSMLRTSTGLGIAGNGSIKGVGSGLRTSESALGLADMQQPDYSGQIPPQNFNMLPPLDIAEMGGNGNDSVIAELPSGLGGDPRQDDRTPTNSTQGGPSHLPPMLDYSPVDMSGAFSDLPTGGTTIHRGEETSSYGFPADGPSHGHGHGHHDPNISTTVNDVPIPSPLQPGHAPPPPPPLFSGHDRPSSHAGNMGPSSSSYQPRYSEEGSNSFDFGFTTGAGPGSSRSSMQPKPATGGGLRVANATEQDEEDWPTEAIMHMNLAGDNVSSLGRY